MSSILVTGAHGFVGRHLMARATVSGLQAIAAEGDLRDAQAVANAVTTARPAAVIHLAATSLERRSADPWKALYDDVAMVANVVRAIAEHAGDAVLVVAGSAAQYGWGRERPLREDDVREPLSAYGVAKDIVERAVVAPALRGGVAVTVARAFNHCGPGQGLDAPAAQWAQQLAAMRLAGGGALHTGDLSLRRDFLDVRDVADVYLALATQGGRASGAVNVCSGEAVALRQVADALIAAAGAPVSIEFDPTLAREPSPPMVVGDPARLHDLIDWRPRYSLAESLADQLSEHLERLETTTA